MPTVQAAIPKVPFTHSHCANWKAPNFLSKATEARIGTSSRSPGAPRLDFVFTVCDNAAAEVCPVWPGQPMTAHWGVPDPAAVDGTDDKIQKAFHHAFIMLDRRISLFLCLPLGSLDSLAIKREIDNIGKR